MKKIILLWALSCLMVQEIFAQCPESPYASAPDKWINRVRLCQYQDDGFKYKLSFSGIYQIVLKNNATGEREVHKIVVMRN